MKDEQFMHLALQLAQRGCGWTAPNPMVGAVIVKDGRIIGQGWHQRCGEPHAERNALAACTEDPRGATLYVTLEPCAMCAGAIASARIKKAYFGAYEPKGGGVESKFHILTESGLNHVTEFEGGVMEKECSDKIKDFFRTRRK